MPAPDTPVAIWLLDGLLAHLRDCPILCDRTIFGGTDTITSRAGTRTIAVIGTAHWCGRTRLATGLSVCVRFLLCSTLILVVVVMTLTFGYNVERVAWHVFVETFFSDDLVALYHNVPAPLYRLDLKVFFRGAKKHEQQGNNAQRDGSEGEHPTGTRRFPLVTHGTYDQLIFQVFTYRVLGSALRLCIARFLTLGGLRLWPTAILALAVVVALLARAVIAGPVRASIELLEEFRIGHPVFVRGRTIEVDLLIIFPGITTR